ncbi:MAG: hypothetical protein AMXMBFR84_46240 [Candidatus Hydrogenedentota bacterium]
MQAAAVIEKGRAEFDSRHRLPSISEPEASFMVKPHHRVYASAFFMDLAAATGFCIVPFFIYDFLGGGAETSGRVAAVQSLVYAICCLLTARFVTRSKNSLIWAVVGATAFTLILPLAALFTNLYLFAIVTVVGFCMGALYWPALQAFLGTEPDPHIRSRRISHYNIAWCIGLAAAGPIAGWLYSIDFRLAFAFIFVGGAASAGFVAFNPGGSTATPEAKSSDSADVPSLAHEASAHLYYAWIANLFGFLLVGVLRSVFTKRIDDLVADGELVLFYAGETGALTYKAAYYYGWLTVVLYASRIGATWLMGIWHNWHYRFSLMVVLQLLAGASFYLLGHTNSLVVMAVCFAVVGTSGAATFFASLYYSVSESEHRYRRSTIHESMTGFGASLGAMLFGELAGRYGNTMPLVYTPWLVAGVLVLQYLLLRYGRSRWTASIRAV